MVNFCLPVSKNEHHIPLFLIPTNRASVSNVRFRAGSSIRGRGGTLHQADQLIANPHYDYYTLDYDVAVAKVSNFLISYIRF